MASSTDFAIQFRFMVRWLKESGAAGLETVELADFPDLGRGLKAMQRYEKGTKILTNPNSVLWTIDKAYSDPLLGPILRSLQPSFSVDDTLAIFMLFIRSRKSGYEHWRSHISVLPESYSSSIFFTDEELEVCAGTSLYTITKQLEQQIEDDYRELLGRLVLPHRDLFPLEKFTIEDYKWALCTVWSRCMDFQLADGSSIRLLAPFIDMLNHSSEIQQCHVYDPISGSLSVIAAKDYEVGEQVFIYYGSIPNNRLLRLYGFVVPGNPHDSYDLVLSTHPNAPLFEQKQNLWTLAGLNSVSTIPLSLTNPLPQNVLQYLRIQRLDESRIAVALQQKEIAGERISNENEVEILQFLVSSLHAHLESFRIPLEKLEEQLADGTYAPESNTWAAAQVSLGEQKVLRLAKEAAEGLLMAVESTSSSLEQCANCGKVSNDLKLCSRCKIAKYCGRECQVAHFQQHKAACRARAQGQVSSSTPKESQAN